MTQTKISSLFLRPASGGDAGLGVRLRKRCLPAEVRQRAGAQAPSRRGRDVRLGRSCWLPVSLESPGLALHGRSDKIKHKVV